MNFVIDGGPHIKDKDNTSKIMRHVMIALIPIIIFAFYKNGIIPYQKGYIGLFSAFRPLIIVFLACLTSLLSELLYVRIIMRKKDQDLKSYIKHSYSLMPGLFLSLIIPINTPLWLVILGSFFAVIIGKMVFGGFGHNIFNPALVGSLFITSSYGALIASRGNYLNAMEIDTISKATPLTNFSSLHHAGSFDSIISTFGSIWDYVFGFIPGALGETSKILILVALIYLILNKVIKWRIPITYLSTVFIMTLIIGLNNNGGIWYPTFNLLSGGLLFGATFMATDPVTSPITRSGQFLYGLCLGILTVVFRFLTPYPEGVLTSILTMNMLVFAIDRIGIRVKFNFYKIIIPTVILIILMLGLSGYIGYKIKPTEVVNNNVNIISKTKDGNNTIYKVTTKGFHGLITSNITVSDKKIININITNEQETYWQSIVDNDYLNKLITGQDNINNVDTISGATVSSTALKDMVEYILNDIESSGNK